MQQLWLMIFSFVIVQQKYCILRKQIFEISLISIFIVKLSVFHVPFVKIPSRCLTTARLFPLTKRNHFNACIYTSGFHLYGRLGAVPSVLLLHLSKWKWCGANNVQTLSAECWVCYSSRRWYSPRPHSNLLMPFEEILPQPPSLAVRTFHGLKRGVAKAKLDWELASEKARPRPRKSKQGSLRWNLVCYMMCGQVGRIVSLSFTTCHRVIRNWLVA